MKERPSIIMTTLGLATLFGLLYRLRQRRTSAKEIRKIHNIVVRNLIETGAVHRTLRRTRGAVNQMHRYLDPVPKGMEKPAS